MAAAPIRLVKLAHMCYRFVDIEKQHQFLLDFGMHFVGEQSGKRYYAGEGPDPYVFITEKVCRATSSQWLVLRDQLLTRSRPLSGRY
jgi:hypothetical protein